MTVPNAAEASSVVDIMRDGQMVLPDVPVTAGSVTVSRSQFTRRSVSLTLPAQYDDGSRLVDLTPRMRATDLISPAGFEVRVRAGLDGETWPQGVFGVRSVDFAEPDGTLSVTGIDRCKRIAERGFDYGRRYVDAQSASSLLRLLVGEVFGSDLLAIDRRAVDAAFPAQTFTSGRDSAVQAIALAMGCEIFSDPNGAIVVQPPPDPNGPADWSFSGDDVLTSLTTTTSRDDVVNSVTVVGQSVGDDPAPQSDPQVDDNPLSLTFAYGPFGLIPVNRTSSLVVAKGQADAMARAILSERIGLARSVAFEMVPEPRLREGQVVGVTTTLADGRKVYEQHIVDGFSFDLSGLTVQKVTTRTSQSQVTDA